MTIRSLHIVTMIFLVLACHKNLFPFCFERAGQVYEISPQLIKAIAYQESAFDSNAIHRNSNGSFDYGVMQINSWWFETLGKERWQALSDPCFNVMVGAWILRGCIDRYGYNWDCLSCYRSGKSLTALGEPVRKDVIRYINRIEYYFKRF